jgi:hypothetical protein
MDGQSGNAEAAGFTFLLTTQVNGSLREKRKVGGVARAVERRLKMIPSNPAYVSFATFTVVSFQ